MQRNTIWYVAAAILVVLGGVALYLSWRANHHPAPAPPAAVTAPVAPAPAIANPVPAPSGAAAEPLPPLESSDKPVLGALGELFGAKSIDALLRPEMLVRHIVVTVDNLPRKHLAVELRPTKDLPGAFAVSGNDQAATIDASNYTRYAPYVHLLQTLNVQQFTTVYFHYYPLFQQAYESLGYPSGYFNDRLVATIDDALAAPDPKGPVALVRPNVEYQFADPKLEDLSSAQKLMIRMGPENEALVKAKLRELRAAVATQKRQ
ncbi:MAG TPA: DUF3014 domain-containing protein [Steroidobacteraceae bacterium]